jgi:predicted dehydrogenase
MLRFALIGTGMVSLANHVPGLAYCPDTSLVALCDADPQVLERAAQATGIDRVYRDAHELLRNEDVDAVIIATPNIFHKPIALAAAGTGRHVFCEKPLALTWADARDMVDAAERAGVRHMTAFTYRFVPAMRYIKHLIDEGFVGRPLHFRAQRFQDWGRRHLAWRQRADMAGSGELGDMLSHRLDFGHHLAGPITRVMARTKQIWDTRFDADGHAHPADVEDWVACLADFRNGATGVFESTKTATGRGDGARGEDYCEINGTEGTLIYRLQQPHEIRAARIERPLETVPVPEAFLKVPGSPRDPASGDPLQNFRYDQLFEFVRAIREGRACQPSFYDGMRVQAVMDAILESARTEAAVAVPDPAASIA